MDHGPRCVPGDYNFYTKACVHEEHGDQHFDHDWCFENVRIRGDVNELMSDRPDSNPACAL